MEGNPSFTFESLKNSIKLIREDPTAIDKLDVGICHLEKKFAKYAKSMAKVLQLHTQMKNEIDTLTETVSDQKRDLAIAKNDAEGLKKIIKRLKRKNHRHKKKCKKIKVVEKVPSHVTTEIERPDDDATADDVPEPSKPHDTPKPINCRRV